MKRSSLSMILVLLAAAGLRAQGPTGPWYAGAMLNTAPSSLSGDTGGARGFAFHGGRTFWTGHAGTGYRLTAEVGTLTGWDLQLTREGARLTQLQVGGELLVNTPVDTLKFVLGVNANRWKTSADQPEGGTYDHTLQGTKLGAKVGLEYFHSPQLSFRLAFQAVEAGTSSDFIPPTSAGWQKPDEGKYAITPSWFQLGVSWHF